MKKLNEKLQQVFDDEEVIQVIISKEEYIDYHNEIERLQSIINEVRKYCNESSMTLKSHYFSDILKILDKENKE